MKNYIQTLALLNIVSFVLIFSCESHLDVSTNEDESGNIYTSVDNIEKALEGAYFNLGGMYDGSDGGELLGGDLVLIAELLSNKNRFQISWESSNGFEFNDFADKSMVRTNSRIEANWRRAYETISTVNAIIKNISIIEDANLQNEVYGQALAIRGVLYFELAKFWGPVYNTSVENESLIPLFTQPIETIDQAQNIELASIKEVYDLINQDLNEASTLLKNINISEGYIDYFTCKAYLTRLNLWQQNYDAAYANADTIIASEAFLLENDPIDAFNNASYSSEDIFAITQTSTSNAGSITTSTGITQYFSSINGQGSGVLRIGNSFPTSSNYENGPQYEEEDLRGQKTTDVSENTTAASIQTMFYTNVLNSAVLSSSKYADKSNVIPVVRLPEIILSRSEAKLMLTNIPDAEIISGLNSSRIRANLEAIPLDSLNDFDACLKAIKQEKIREFIFEGIIFHDLKRWNDSINGSPAIGENFILPIPQSECDATDGLCE